MTLSFCFEVFAETPIDIDSQDPGVRGGSILVFRRVPLVDILFVVSYSTILALPLIVCYTAISSYV